MAHDTQRAYAYACAHNRRDGNQLYNKSRARAGYEARYPKCVCALEYTFNNCWTRLLILLREVQTLERHTS